MSFEVYDYDYKQIGSPHKNKSFNLSALQIFSPPKQCWASEWMTLFHHHNK